MSFIHYLRKTFDWRSRYIAIWELPLQFSSLSPPDPNLWDQSFSPADGGIDFKRIQVSWCLQTTHLLFYLILEVLLHSKQISNFLVVDLKERCLKRTKSYLTFFTRRTIFVTNLKFVLPVLLLQPLLCLKYLLDCPAKYSIVSQYLHLNFTTFKAYLGIIP